MFGTVPVVSRSLAEYEEIIGAERYAEICRIAEPLRDARVLHLNATALGGGVAEILASLVPLMNDLGLHTEWQVIRGAEEFFNVTKAMHNTLQGMFLPWTPEMREVYNRYTGLNADFFDEEYDFVVIHDPQPAGILGELTQRGREKHGKWIWRCHIDLTDAQPDVWDFLRPLVEDHDAAIFTLEDFVKKDLGGPVVFVIPPAIDPLSLKNSPRDEATVEEVLRRFGLDPARPLLLQVSRFDPWKDPLGVIDAYRIVKQEVPELQLLMVGSMAHDDPEGWSYYERTVRRAGEDYDVHILHNLNGVGNLEVGVFQSAATVIVQKSIKEGFGLTVSEALWKAKPVVAGRAGGIPLQVLPEETGYLVDNVEQCAQQILRLIQNPAEARRLGEAGREHVRRNFLNTRYLADYLRIFNGLATQSADSLRGVAK
ncbi:MAG TPA: glycosyltransferase [Dehalococcoidia bacterium]|nr:glycosyltransferase [Dehalococcoidia bacterium]